MKKYAVLLLIICVLFITGCGTKKEDSIVGTWSRNYNAGSFSYTFNKDGTCLYENGSKKIKCTYKTEDNDLTIIYEKDTTGFGAKYSIKDNKLTIKEVSGKKIEFDREK